MHRVLIGKESQTDLAKEYRVSLQLIHTLISTLKKKKEFIGDMIDEAEKRELLRHEFSEFVDDWYLSGREIVNAERIVNEFRKETLKTIKVEDAKMVMRDFLEMGYSKINKVPMTANSEVNLILRQRAAIEFLHLYQKRTRMIVIDETWIGETNFRRRLWQKKKHKISQKGPSVRPRITMIAALDNNCEVYLSLLQANSDSETMTLYLKELVWVLDQENEQWRKNTVLVMDGAPYHMSKETRVAMSDLNIPLLFFGPYSYLLSPCELFFSLFKSVNINPEGAPVGKK